MKLGLINSAFYQAGVDTVTGLKHISRIGFDCVDIATEAVGISKQEITCVARTTEKLNLPVISLPFTASGLIDFQKPVRRLRVERRHHLLGPCGFEKMLPELLLRPRPHHTSSSDSPTFTR